MRQPRQSLPLISAEPMQVLVRRAGAVESSHTIDVAICDAQGSVLVGLGDVEHQIFPRSAMKPLQAIALAEKSIHLSEQKKLTTTEYSLICASHNGQRIHVDAARHLLKKFDLSPDLLVCGAHWSSDQPTAISQIRSLEVPTKILNNCSGKHAGMLVLASLLGAAPDGYAALSHPVQQSILGTLETMTGIDLMQFPHGVDGCGAPALSGPLGNWARGFALLGILLMNILGFGMASGGVSWICSEEVEACSITADDSFSFSLSTFIPAFSRRIRPSSSIVSSVTHSRPSRCD